MPTDANVDPSTTPDADSFYPETPETKPDATAGTSPARSETPEKSGAVETEAAPEPADHDTEPESKSKSPRSSWADMRQARYRAEAEVTLLREQLAERNKATSSTAPPPAETKPAADPAAPKSDDFDTYDAYLDARDKYREAQWEAKKAAEVRAQETAKAQAQAEAESAKHRERFDAREKIVKAQSPEYEAHFQAFYAAAKACPALGTAVFESEISPDLCDHLGANPEELTRLQKLSPGRIWAEIGKLEIQLVDRGTSPPITTAPRPLQVVGGTASRAPKDKTDEELFYGAN